MKVLMVHNFYRQTGGEDLVVRAELEQLRARGVEVLLYARHSDEIGKFGLGSKCLIPLRAVHSPRAASDLALAIRQFRPDVAWVHNIYPLISPAVYSAFSGAGVPIVQMFHNYRPFCVNGLLLRSGSVCQKCVDGSSWNALRYRCFRDSYSFSAMYAAATFRSRGWMPDVHRVVCPSRFVRAKLMEAGIPGEKVQVRPHFIDTSAVAPSLVAGQYALYLGRLSAEKGIHTLLEAFAELPEVPLVIAGAGPQEGALRLYATCRSMKNVKFVGFQTGQGKWDLIENAAFVVVPSEWHEIFGMSVLEAFAKAKPVLGARIGSLPDLIEPGVNGLLFNSGDACDLAMKAGELFRNAAACAEMGRRARSMAEEKYNPGVAFKLLMAAFQC